MRRIVPLLAGLVALAVTAAAGATPPTPVTIMVVADFSGPVPHGVFTASARLCPSGTFVTEPIAGGGGRVAFAFVGRQHFSCAASGGTFTLQFHPQVHPPDFADSGPWAALGGTGAYDGLRGAGDFLLLGFISPTTAVASFVGEVHFD